MWGGGQGASGGLELGTSNIQLDPIIHLVMTEVLSLVNLYIWLV